MEHSAVRVKEESNEKSLIENNCEMSDIKNVQLLPFLQEDSNPTLQKCDLNDEFDDEMEIVVECEDVKPNFNILVVKKIEDDSVNHLRNLRDDDAYETQYIIKTEPVDEVKQEVAVEESNLNFDCELVEQNQKRRTKKDLNKEYNLKSLIDVKHNGITHTCDICKKTFKQKSYLNRHVQSVHNVINHTCGICEKKFSTKHYLKVHIDVVHKGVTHVCDICGKKFSQKSNLKTHIDTVHSGITYTCDICKRTFIQKASLSRHVQSVHDGITHMCDICEKKFSQRSTLKIHIDSVHNGITHACDICGKKFSSKKYLKLHTNSVHSTISHT